MKIRLLLLIAAALCASLIAADGRLSPRFRTVYILEMANGLDQHLALRLTANRAMWVVLEPPSADAVLTQSVDEAFWNWLARTYPSSAAAPRPPAPSAPPPSATGTGTKKDASSHEGMVFLVDPRTRVVLWSAWERPLKTTPDELDRTAQRIALQIKSAFEKK